MNTLEKHNEEVAEKFDEKKQELKDYLYGTVHKGYDLEELSKCVQEDVDKFFTKDFIQSQNKQLYIKIAEGEIEKNEKVLLEIIAMPDSSNKIIVGVKHTLKQEIEYWQNILTELKK